MAGDGFNDAGALAAADIGIAISGSDQVNLDAADVLIPGEDPGSFSTEALARGLGNGIPNITISVLVTSLLVIGVIMGYRMNLAAGALRGKCSDDYLEWDVGIGSETRRLSTGGYGSEILFKIQGRFEDNH